MASAGAGAPVKLAVVGGGWAGLAAAIAARRQGMDVTLCEAARVLGGRARALDTHETYDTHAPTGRLDNGQHILIGAYTETIRLMTFLGVDLARAFHRGPLDLRFADGRGLVLPDLPPPWDVLVGTLTRWGWPLRERLQLLRWARDWQGRGYVCDADLTVRQVCAGLGPRVQEELIDPLCVSALNTPAEEASAQVFLRVLHDALFAGRGGSHLWLPRCDLGALLPEPARRWLESAGARVRLGTRVRTLARTSAGWQLDLDHQGEFIREPFDAVILGVTAPEAARLVASVAPSWSAQAAALSFEAIATVYARGAEARLRAPLVALRPGPDEPAQFVVDRGQLTGDQGLLAFVVSASHGSRALLQAQVLAQARRQLGLLLNPVQTVVEKRATFACRPGLDRPDTVIAPGLVACGDYVRGPYPATLEGAVRSGALSVEALTEPHSPVLRGDGKKR